MLVYQVTGNYTKILLGITYNISESLPSGILEVHLACENRVSSSTSQLTEKPIELLMVHLPREITASLKSKK